MTNEPDINPEDVTHEYVSDLVRRLHVAEELSQKHAASRMTLKVAGAVGAVILLAMFSVAYIDALVQRSNAREELVKARVELDASVIELRCRSAAANIAEDTKLTLLERMGEAEVLILKGLSSSALGEPIDPSIVDDAERLADGIAEATAAATEAQQAREDSLQNCNLTPDEVTTTP